MEKFGLLFWICFLIVQHLSLKVIVVTAQYQLPPQIQQLETVTHYQMPNGERYSCETKCYPQVDCDHFMCLSNPPNPICKFCIKRNIVVNPAPTPTPEFIQAHLAKLYAERQNAIAIAVQQQWEQYRAKLREYLANQIKEHRISVEEQNGIEAQYLPPEKPFVPAPSLPIPPARTAPSQPIPPARPTKLPIVCPLVEAQKKVGTSIPRVEIPPTPVVTTTEKQITSPQINQNDNDNVPTEPATTTTDTTTEATTTTTTTTTAPTTILTAPPTTTSTEAIKELPTAGPTICEILAQRERERLQQEELIMEENKLTSVIPQYNITETTDLPIAIHALDVTEPTIPFAESPPTENMQTECASGSMCFVSIVPTVVSYPGYKIVYGPNSNISCSIDSNVTHIPCENRDKIVQFINEALKSGRLIQHESGISGEQGIIAPDNANLQFSLDLMKLADNGQNDANKNLNDIRKAITANGAIISAVHNTGMAQGLDGSNMGTYITADNAGGSVSGSFQPGLYSAPYVGSSQWAANPSQYVGSTKAQMLLQQQREQQIRQALHQRQLQLQQQQQLQLHQQQQLQQKLHQQQQQQQQQHLTYTGQYGQAGPAGYIQATKPYYQQGSYITSPGAANIIANNKLPARQEIAKENAETSNNLLNLKLQAQIQPNQFIKNGLKSILPTQMLGLNRFFGNDNNQNPARRTNYFAGGGGDDSKPK